tara:strand:- start:241 stop:414 length:174 start_codon:yes stop_codon:yes gene_type:complete
MKRFILIFLLFSGCVYKQNTNINAVSDINFSDDLTLEEFKLKLEEYANNSPYPNIDD